MKVVILAGGLGTRLAEESQLRPKPMIEVGGRPLLWHIMKIYSASGFNDFIICAGYKSHIIKEYFANYHLLNSDITFDFTQDGCHTTIHSSVTEPWKVTVVDTGLDTMTGGRIRRVQPHIGNEPFLLTYGDAVADIDIKKQLAFHRTHGKTATITAVYPEARFGALDIKGDQVFSFREKNQTDEMFINGGFMILEPAIFQLLKSDTQILEREPLETLAVGGQLMAYRHLSFWQCVDTLRDKNRLEAIWQSNCIPWKIW